MSDYLFRGSLEDLDPHVFKLTQLESERQYKKLILIPSESTSPLAVREALSTAFHNIYAEGYPEEASRYLSEDQILDYDERLPYYRRFSDPRYYKGVEYANIVEALARRRAAEAYAANGFSPDEIFVNVQALSGAPANNAVYHALVKPGDTVMGMNLLYGGHLSHGSPVNRSGKYYNIVHYTVNPETELLDYDQIQTLAEEHKPKMIIAGYSSYPGQVDWAKFREIADSVGAYLLADISHISGLIVGGVHPSPVGHAHVITSTTHKTLCGPRGAVILTTIPLLSRKIDRAVFPGEQGGPHVNVFAALALAFKLAKTDQFANLQAQIVKNAKVMADQFNTRGLRVPFSGTETHMLNLDVKSIVGQDDVTLSGDQAARILDIAGLVTNRNTIPGDRSALNPSGIRLGTPWITQRGFDEKMSAKVADLMADVLLACEPYRQTSSRRLSQRAKIDYKVLESVKMEVRDLASQTGLDYEPPLHGYPHYYYQDDTPESSAPTTSYKVTGEKASALLNFALSASLDDLTVSGSQQTKLHLPDQTIEGVVKKTQPDEFLLQFPKDQANQAANWLRTLSDGFVKFDEDLMKKLAGPVAILEIEAEEIQNANEDAAAIKPYYIGMPEAQEAQPALPDFTWEEPADPPVQQTPLNQTHRDLGAKMIPFAGWDMPVWYTSVMEEHLAVREAAGLFD
ncbi:MAG TPA: serine hydroxymethyltransferase, partial [Anaerolineales bacterium]|nr:serine hydroxymethyltransferase [Anaerolineales bacterium]